MRAVPAMAMLVMVGAMAVGCGTAPRTDAPPTSPPSAIAGPSPRASAGPSPSSPALTPVPVDVTLLELLPSDIDGVEVQADPETAAEIALDPALGRDAQGLAVALAIVPGEADGEIAIANLIRLRPGVFSEAFFGAWRDTYDEGACGPAGGVTGRAEAEIGGHRTFIGSCAAGVRTYHVHLPARDVLLSVTALGERRLGEHLIAAVEPAP